MRSFTRAVGSIHSPRDLGRAALAVALFAVVSTAIPQPGAASPSVPVAAPPAAAARAVSLGVPDELDPIGLVQRYRDPEAKVSIVPPEGWRGSPLTSLDRDGDDDLYEVARFQLRLGDAALYAQPLPVTSGLLADAGAVLSIALAREDSDLAHLDLSALDPDALERIPGAIAIDSETSYEGVVTITRTIVARGTGRTAVVRAFVPVAERDALAPVILAALATATVDAEGPVGPKYVPPPPPPPPAPAPDPEPESAAAAPPVGPSSGTRGLIIARAADMLGTPYVWGGNVAGRGMDCSAYVSAAWGVARYSTDSIWNVAVAIGKEQLLPGDALDLETWRDPARYGHIRLFDAWANAEHTLVWVYEETPPRAIHRVIAYDARYQPIRLGWLAGGGVAPLVPAPAAQPAPRLGPAPVATRRPTATARPATTPRPTVRPTLRPTPKPTAKPTVRPTATPRATATSHVLVTPAPTVRAATTPRPAPTATVRVGSVNPRPSAAPTRR